MPDIEHMKRRVIDHIVELSMDPNGPEEFEENSLTFSLLDIAGPAIIRAVLEQLWLENLLGQSSADPIKYTVTFELLKLASSPKSNANEPQSEETILFTAFRDSLLVYLAKQDAKKPELYDLKGILQL